MIIPIQIYNYFEGYIVSNEIHNKSGVMGGNIPLRLLDLKGVSEFYNGNNPMHINNSLLNHFTNAWIHIGCSDMMKIMESDIGFKYPRQSNIIIKSITHGDMIIIGSIMSMNPNIDISEIGLIFQNSIALLGYYIIDPCLGVLPIDEIDIGKYEDWCYLEDTDWYPWLNNNIY